MSYATSLVNDLAPYRKNARSRIYSPTSSTPCRKTTPTSKLIKQAVDCLVRKTKLQPPNANFMTRLNATVRTRFKVAATLRKIVGPIALKKKHHLSKNRQSPSLPRRRTARDNLGGRRRVPAPKNREFMDVGIAGAADPASACRRRLTGSLGIHLSADVRKVCQLAKTETSRRVLGYGIDSAQTPDDQMRLQIML